MASAGKSEIRFPSNSLVKYLNIAAAVIGVAGIVLDAIVPIAQQMGKKKAAREGLEPAIRMTILLALVRTVPALFRAVRTLRSQVSSPVSSDQS